MYELTGKIDKFSVDYGTNKAFLMLSINEMQDLINCYNELSRCEKVSFKIDKYREKRSLMANNYAWHLLNEMANILRQNKDEIYLDMLKKYGQRVVVSVKANIPINEFVKYYDEMGESILKGELFKHYYVYKGSSEFDTREMSIFIDGIVDEAKEMGIQTETPEQIENMKSLWKRVDK